MPLKYARSLPYFYRQTAVCCIFLADNWGQGSAADPGITKKIQTRGRRGPQLLGNVLPIVLARLGVGAVQSTASGEQDPR
jgi:hypothetical protein